ncbi:MAG: N-acetyl-gamma-glutamyl-phosphate reductase [Chitinispirillaceae bacterium]|nr:N-acetyl-gamma-glutamyl-phosphate reductase [Chitinispirillaceae bacterium]
MFSVFIDGQEGTTGLQIHERLKNRTDLTIHEIPVDKRKDPATKKEFLNDADIVILCLPDTAARESVAMITNPETRVIDASTAHRIAPDWVYGLPELTKNQRQKIKEATRVANPGCYPTGFLLLVRPLIELGIIAPDYPVTSSAISGYSGGGKKLIASYEAPLEGETPAAQLGSRNYALGLNHKHIPEMRQHALLNQPPIFLPIVCAYYNGMNVTVPLYTDLCLKKVTPSELHRLFCNYFEYEPFITVKPLETEQSLENGFLNPVRLNGTNRCDLFVFGNDRQIVLAARFDNLGKGASGAAVQNMNIMMGVDETTGL